MGGSGSFVGTLPHHGAPTMGGRRGTHHQSTMPTTHLSPYTLYRRRLGMIEKASLIHDHNGDRVVFINIVTLLSTAVAKTTRTKSIVSSASRTKPANKDHILE